MATATELIVAEELDQLRQLAESQDGWSLPVINSAEFLLGVPRKGGGELWVHCELDQYPTLPPIWRWCDPDGKMFDDPRVTPIGGSSYFIEPGILCAPWNRLAYKGVDARGPHTDWDIGDWKANSHTRQCKTLAAMASRIAIEARLRFAGMKQA